MKLSLIITIACITFITLVAYTKPKEVIVTKVETRFVEITCPQVKCVRYIPKAWADLSSNQK